MPKYNDFKSYIQATYKKLLEKAVSDYIAVPNTGYGYCSFSSMSVCRQHVENLEVKTVCCHDDMGPLIKIDVNLTADIVTDGIGTRRYDVDRQRKWYTVFLSAQLRNGMHDVKVLDTKEHYDTTFDKEDALDEYLVPYIYTDMLEDIADDFYEFYWEPAADHQDEFPYIHILNEMGIKAYKAPLPNNVFGRMYFRPAEVQHYYKQSPTVQEEILTEKVPAGTMLISKDCFFMSDVGGTYNTIAHEMAHWEHHQKFFEILALLDQDNSQLSCEVSPSASPAELTGVKKAIWWAEWQANCLAIRYQMPRRRFTEVFDSIYAEKCTCDFHDRGRVMEETILAVAKKFGVSKFAAKTRAIQLGYDDADGAFLYVNGRHFFPLSFKRGSLSKNETFIIDLESLERQLTHDATLAALLESELFVYAGCTFCINDPKYVDSEEDPYGIIEYQLTEYAKSHLDECCIKFIRTFTSRQGLDYEFYGQCFLSKEVRASAYCETSKVDEEDKQDKKNKAIELQKLKQEGTKIMDIYRELPNSFSGTLKAHMKRVQMISTRTGKPCKITQLELAGRTGLSEDYIGQLCNNPKGVTLETVCALCISLHLHPILSMDLIRKSKNEFSDDDEGFFGQYLIQHQYTSTLEECNNLLAQQGYKIWGKATA